jgi:ATP/maltotriose-dependent transcriptional regulator MalT
MIGRQREVAAVSRLLDALPAGPGALLLDGEAGIGKTLVWQAGVDDALTRGIHVLRARPAGSEVQLSFAGLGDLLGQSLDETLPGLPEPQQRALRSALLLEARPTQPDQRAVGLAFLSVLRLHARDRPVLVAVDDLQWLDRPSGRVLEFALRRLDSEPIGLLAAIRGAPGAVVPFELDRAFAERVQRISLPAFTLGGLHELLRTRLGLRLPRPALRRLHDASGGNPFYALEIGSELQRHAVELAPGEPLPIPAGLRALLRDRIERLPQRTRSVLLSAAVLSNPTVPLLAEVHEQAEADLERALRAGVIELEEERVRFSHPLLAVSARSEASPLERRKAHRRVAEVVTNDEERARHLALATERPDAGVAAAVEQAARQAAARGAPDVAAELSTLSVRLTPRDAGGDRLRRRLASVDFEMVASEYAPARATLEQLLDELSPGAERAGVLARLMRIVQETDLRGGLVLGERALDEPGIDDETRASVYRDRGLIWLNLGDLGRSRTELAAAAEAAERSGSPFACAEALGLLGLFDAFAGKPRPPEFWKRARAFEEKVEGRAADYGPLQSHGMQLMYADRLDEAREVLHEAQRRAQAWGDVVSVETADLHLVELEVRAGDLKSARRHADSFFLVLGKAEFELSHGPALYGKALVDAYQGHAGDARAAIEEGLAAADRASDRLFRAQNLAVLGFLELSLGQTAEAASVLRPVWDELKGMGYGDPSIVPVLPNAVEALIATGEHEEARRQLAHLQERAHALDSPWALSQAARCRGLLAAAEGEPETALEQFEEALTVHERLPVPFERARTLLALGSVQRRANQKRAARETLEQAVATFEELGVPLWVEKARVELGRIGGRAVPRRGELTATERAIAGLVAAGRTNNEVAAALALSPRTVQWNLSKIYRKVGVRSRTELAAALAGADEARER